jgi:hypothetical protein
MDELTGTQGVALRDKRGRLLAPIPGSEQHQFTPANARMAAEARWEQYRSAAVARVVEEGKALDPTIKGGAGAWGLLVAKQYLALLDSDKPRGDDLYRIGQVLGAVPTAHEARALEHAASQEAGPALAVELVSLLRDIVVRLVELPAPAAEVIDADASNTE